MKRNTGRFCNEPINWDRAEHESCERGTESCCVDHTGDPDYLNCIPWEYATTGAIGMDAT